MKKILLLSLNLFLFSCGTVWIVERNQDSGIIGYKGYSSSESANKAIRSLIHCSSYNFVYDKLVDGGSSTVYVPVQSTNYSNGSIYGSGVYANYNGTQTQTNYVPQQVSNVWREFKYTCSESSRQTASESNYSTSSTVSNVQSCEDFCRVSESKGELQKGMTIQSCISRLCK